VYYSLRLCVSKLIAEAAEKNTAENAEKTKLEFSKYHTREYGGCGEKSVLYQDGTLG
jgi:hypothetical protein